MHLLSITWLPIQHALVTTVLLSSVHAGGL
jgi:hypothetical protein